MFEGIFEGVVQTRESYGALNDTIIDSATGKPIKAIREWYADTLIHLQTTSVSSQPGSTGYVVSEDVWYKLEPDGETWSLSSNFRKPGGGGGTPGGIPEAPNNGNGYIRKALSWLANNALNALTDADNNVYELGNEGDGGYMLGIGSQFECGFCINGGNGAAGNYPQIYFDSWSLPGAYNATNKTWTHNGVKSRMLVQLFADGLKFSTDGATWAPYITSQPAYTNMPLQTLMDASSALGIAGYFVVDASSVWTFADVTAEFTVPSIDAGASRVIGDGESSKIYYENAQYGEITEPGGTYQFAGPVLFRGLNSYTGDIGGITVTQNAIASGLADLAATIANASGWLQRQIDAILSATQNHITAISLGGAAYTLPNSAGYVEIPRGSAAILINDPNDFGTVATVADLPVAPQSNHERYIGVVSGGSQNPEVTKFAPEFDGTVAAEITDPHCVVKDTEVNDNWTFDTIRLTKAPVTTDMRDAWKAVSGWNNEDMPLVYLQRAEVITDILYDTVAMLGALKKNLNFRFTTTYGGDVQIYDNAGAYVGVDGTVALSQEFGWQAGDAMHYDDASGKMWVTDNDGNRVILRVAVVFDNTTPITNWGLTLSWLHYIGVSFWRDNVGAYVWTDQNEVYTPGGQIQGEDKRGYIDPQDFARFSDTYTKAEIDAMFAALAT
jgi:hypothetical protein